jgi:pimeloyl-ACP methyl ester carboxylesterase
VLAHGYVQSSRLWAGQVRDLLDARPDLCVVTYEYRGHGRSGRTERERATLPQLGRDLACVLDEGAPAGPVVVAGHSMGGMTVMALAEERPDLFGERIVGAAFVGTSAGQLDTVTHGLPRPVATAVRRALPALNEAAVRAELRGRTRAVGAADAFMIFPRTADKGLVREALEVHRGCSAETVAAFLATFSDHDRAQALAALAHVPAVVLAGDRDRLCPVSTAGPSRLPCPAPSSSSSRASATWSTSSAAPRSAATSSSSSTEPSPPPPRRGRPLKPRDRTSAGGSGSAAKGLKARRRSASPSALSVPQARRQRSY